MSDFGHFMSLATMADVGRDSPQQIAINTGHEANLLAKTQRSRPAALVSGAGGADSSGRDAHLPNNRSSSPRNFSTREPIYMKAAPIATRAMSKKRAATGCGALEKSKKTNIKPKHATNKTPPRTTVIPSVVCTDLGKWIGLPNLSNRNRWRIKPGGSLPCRLHWRDRSTYVNTPFTMKTLKMTMT
jgi:hypothetical protein